MAYREVGLRDMLSAALETRPLPSLGVVATITTPTTNLSLFRQSQRHGLSSSWAKRHALRGSRDKLSTFSGVVTPITTPTTNLSLFRQSQRHGLSSSLAKRHALRGPRGKFSTFFRNRYTNNYSDYQPFFVPAK